MFVSDLRHFLDLPDDVPMPARRMAEHLGSVVRAATSTKAGSTWETALTCRRRPGNRPCPGHIAVFRADLPAPIEWKCTSCGDEGVISGWQDSYFDLRTPRSGIAKHTETSDILLTEEVAVVLRDLRLLDSACERLVFGARASAAGIVLAASQEDLDELLGFVAAEANHETNRRRRKRLDAAFTALSEALAARKVVTPLPSSVVEREVAIDVSGKWRIFEMDLWDRDALDLVGDAFIDFGPDGTGCFGFIAVTGWMDCRRAEIGGRPGVEFTWDGADEGDQVSGRGWAALEDDRTLRGHIYFHLGDDSGFRAELMSEQ
jgi:hypothetical protein